MCKTKPKVLHLFLLILFGIGLFACNQPTEQLLPDLEGIEVDIESLMDAYDIEDFSMQGMLLILYYDNGTTDKIPITPNMIRQVDVELLSTPGTHTITITHGRFTTTLNLTMVYTGLTEQLRLIYYQGLESGLITGTYEAWLDSIKGADGVSITAAIINENGHLILTFSNDEVIDVGRVVGNDGEDGLPIILKVEDGYIKWSYEGESTWTNLLALIDLIGLTGDDGVGIKQININAAYELVITLTDDEIINLGDIRGEQGLPGLDGSDGLDGKQVLFQVHSGYIQWKYIDDVTWNDLIEIATLIGPKGDKGDTGDQGLPGDDGLDGKEVIMQVSSGYIQWKYIDDVTWNNLIELSSLIGPQGIQGDTGDQGLPGSDGIDGKEVIMQVSGGYIQWKYIDDVTWNNFIEIATLIGPQGIQGDTGDQGLPGTDGIDGKEVIMQVASGYIQWKYIDDVTWNNLIELSSLIGPQGIQGDTGDQGLPGTDGVDGKEVIMQVSGGYIQWKYIDDVTWNNLIELETLTGAQGVGIASIEINLYGELIVTYTDNTTVNLGTIVVYYIVQFKTFMHGVIEVQLHYYGATAEAPLAPMIEGYTFTGWNKAFDNITVSMTIEASYEINMYEIVFETMGGEPIKTLENVEHESTIDLPIPVKEGYIFTGWFDGLNVNAHQYTSSTLIKNHAILYATWVKMAQVSFEVYGGTEIESIYGGVGTPLYRPEKPEKLGHTFINWYLDEAYATLFYFSVMPSEPITLYAKWQVNDYTIHFESNGGTFIESTTKPYQSGIESPFPPEKHGHTFAGWYVDELLTEPFIFDTMPAYDLTLYAKWDVNSYSISYYVSDIPVASIGIGLTHNQYVVSTIDSRVFNVQYHTLQDTTHHFDLNPDEYIMRIEAGYGHYMGLTNQGRLFTWGSNSHGQLGNGGTGNYSDITEAFGLVEGETILDFAAGGWHSTLVTSHGRVFTWGSNGSGQLGRGATGSSNIPILINQHFGSGIDEDHIVKVAAGESSSFALSQAGKLYGFGGNSYSVLADNPGSFTPQLIFYSSVYGNMIDISVFEFHVVALTDNGYVLTWGRNNRGQLGEGSSSHSRQSMSNIIDHFNLAPDETIISIHAGNLRSFAATSHGRTFFWGGFSAHTFIPVDITALLEEASHKVVGHLEISVIQTLSNAIYATHSSQGDLDYIMQELLSTKTYLSTDAYDYDTPLIYLEINKDYYLQSDWYVSHASGEKALYETMPAYDMDLYMIWMPVPYTITYELNGGENHALNRSWYNHLKTLSIYAPTKEGHTFLGWYLNEDFEGDVITEIDYGSYGDITLYASWSVNSYTMTYVIFDPGYNPDYMILLDSEETILKVEAGYAFSILLTSNGRIFTWGNNNEGQLGNGDFQTRPSPLEITQAFNLEPGEIIIDIYAGYEHAAALTSHHRVFTWGSNNNGQIGNTNDSGEPFSIPYNITGYFTLIEGDFIVKLALGRLHTMALSNEGEVYVWGSNYNGQLGFEDWTVLYSPTSLNFQFTLEEDDKIVHIQAAYEHSGALTLEGHLFTWGGNHLGQLGDGTTNQRNTPNNITTQFSLGPGEKIIEIYFAARVSYAIDSEQNLYVWGSNLAGQHANGTSDSIEYSNIPLNISSHFPFDVDESIVYIAVGESHTKLSTSKNNLYVWGSNSSYQLGDDVSHQDTPMLLNHQLDLSDQIITYITAGGGHNLLLTSNNELYSWGWNEYGQIGNGLWNNITRPTPINISKLYGVYPMVYEYGTSTGEYILDYPGYVLSDWYDGELLLTLYTFTTMPANDLTIYAYWIRE